MKTVQGKKRLVEKEAIYNETKKKCTQGKSITI